MSFSQALVELCDVFRVTYLYLDLGKEMEVQELEPD